MKKTKRLISILMAISFILMSLTVSFVARAESNEEKAEAIVQALEDFAFAFFETDEATELIELGMEFLNLYKNADDNVKELLKEAEDEYDIIDQTTYFDMVSTVAFLFDEVTEEDLDAAGLTQDDYYNLIEEFIYLYDNAEDELLEYIELMKEFFDYKDIYDEFVSILEERPAETTTEEPTTEEPTTQEPTAQETTTSSTTGAEETTATSETDKETEKETELKDDDNVKTGGSTAPFAAVILAAAAGLVIAKSKKSN